MANFTRIGFGQVEPNHLSAQRTAQIYGQLPAADSISLLENGQFVKYNYAAGVVDFDATDGEWMMVFNEVKLYDDWRESYKDFAMIKDNYTPGSDITHVGYPGPFTGTMTPRVIKTNVGDIFTTNCIAVAGTKGTSVTMSDTVPAVGAYLAPNATGYLAVASSKPASGMVWQVAKVTTMPDGQQALKLQRIQ